MGYIRTFQQFTKNVDLLGPRIFFCETLADRPVTGLRKGDEARVAEDGSTWIAASATTWGARGWGWPASLPAGVIVVWSGTLATIPSGFVLCDGQNGTPDFRDKFQKGAAAGADPGATGGSATHTHADHPALAHSGAAVADHAAQAHSGAAVADHASHSHTYTQVPNHVHGFTDLRGLATGVATTTRAVTEGSDTSSTPTGLKTANPDSGVAQGTTAGPDATLAHNVTQPAAHPALVHGVTQPSNHAAQAHVAANNEPVWYAVAFIMKT